MESMLQQKQIEINALEIAQPTQPSTSNIFDDNGQINYNYNYNMSYPPPPPQQSVGYDMIDMNMNNSMNEFDEMGNINSNEMFDTF